MRIGIRELEDYPAEDMVRAGKVLGPKLISLKVPDVKLQKYQKELIATRLDFLQGYWNCISATIQLAKNKNVGTDLCDNPLLWMIEHWTRILEPCASEGN